jgi:hypothetical protein
MQHNNKPSYKIYAQNRDASLIIKNNEQNNFAIQFAADILSNPGLIDDFSQQDQLIILSIAADKG